MTGHVCKHLLSMRDGPGERGSGRNLKCQMRQNCLNRKHNIIINNNNGKIYQATLKPCYFIALGRQTNFGSSQSQTGIHKGQISPPSKTVKPSKTINISSQRLLKHCRELVFPRFIDCFARISCQNAARSRSPMKLIMKNAAINPDIKQLNNFLLYYPLNLCFPLSISSLLPKFHDRFLNFYFSF